MSSVINVAIHASQSPEQVREDFLHGLRARQINHKFLYESYKQSQKWLALHQAYSPSRNDPDCAAAYDRGFAAAAGRVGSPVHLIGLGCGGGQKDVRLLQLLKGQGKHASYTPCDVSLALVLTSRKAAVGVIPEADCHPLVCDLASAEDLPQAFAEPTDPQAARLLTFFGMIPNFEPFLILPRLAALVRPPDWLLFSANLAPGGDYDAGAQGVLPGYDNALTRDWLETFLFDLGVERGDGETQFFIQEGEQGLKRIVAEFRFAKNRSFQIEAEAFEFRIGDTIRLFFSYRYTPDRARAILQKYHMEVVEQWLAKSGEEGVFLCRRA